MLIHGISCSYADPRYDGPVPVHAVAVQCTSPEHVHPGRIHEASMAISFESEGVASLQNVADRSTHYIIYLQKTMVANTRGLWRMSPLNTL
jgi:hypothetical protein